MLVMLLLWLPCLILFKAPVTLLHLSWVSIWASLVRYCSSSPSHTDGVSRIEKMPISRPPLSPKLLQIQSLRAKLNRLSKSLLSRQSNIQLSLIPLLSTLVSTILVLLHAKNPHLAIQFPCHRNLKCAMLTPRTSRSDWDRWAYRSQLGKRPQRRNLRTPRHSTEFWFWRRSRKRCCWSQLGQQQWFIHLSGVGWGPSWCQWDGDWLDCYSSCPFQRAELGWRPTG